MVRDVSASASVNFNVHVHVNVHAKRHGNANAIIIVMAIIAQFSNGCRIHSSAFLGSLPSLCLAIYLIDRPM